MHLIFLAICLLFSSCSSPSQWTADQIKTEDEDSLRVTHQTEDPVNGMDVMLLKLKDQSVIYLQVHGPGFIADRLDAKKVHIKLKTQEKTYRGFALCHEGQQRLILPDSLKELLITLLQDQKAVTIEAGGYREILSPQGFTLSKKLSFIPKLLFF